MLIKNWTMKYDNFGELSCQSPCSMYGVLFEAGKIADPFVGENEKDLTALSEKGCEFYAEFDAGADILSKEFIELTFYGLDTICDIYLNEACLGSVMNMHRTFTYDVKDLLKAGKNTLKLHFSSPVEYIKKMQKRRDMHIPLHTIRGASHLRKALYMCGWDWGPTLPDMGIFRDVEVRAYDTDKIEDFEVLQYHENGAVTLEIKANTKTDKADLFAHIDGQCVQLCGGRGKIKIENPRLWWVRGYGEQNLYDLKITAEYDGKVIDETDKKIGLRTIELSHKKDKHGKEFTFLVNGVEIFAMGANYIPNDNILSRVTTDVLDRVINDAKFANYNCFRVWGGGYYPEDYFYDLCDKEGFLVWQDIMVACCGIWLLDEMKENITQEAICNIKWLRHHPSLGLICGNNEVEEQIYAKEWGTETDRAEYVELYERVLASVTLKYAPQISYWPSSPSAGGGFLNPKDPTDGDIHFWAVWHGGVPFTEYRNHQFRFCSEYGFESFPSVKTIESFCAKKDMNAFSRVMESHQKSPSGNSKILTYLADNYLYPNNFEDLVYASQLLQADAIKYGVEYFRKIRYCCKGSLYWQMNDCWPVVSWSSVDYFGRYKALHYAARKFYAPVLGSIFAEDDRVEFYVMNETMKTLHAKAKITIATSDFEAILEREQDICVDKLTTKMVESVDFLPENPCDTFCVFELFDESGNLIIKNTELFVPAKHFEWKKPDIKVKIEKRGDTAYISFASDVYAKSVFVDFEGFDLVLSDNFFDLTGESGYTVYAKTEKSVEELNKSIKIKTVYDIGR